jgi:YfiH family protein
MNRWRALRNAEPGFPGWVLGHQVHGTRVLVHPGVTGWVTCEGADGQATRTGGVMLLVTVADCIPIYLIDPVRRAAALLHSGWRGTAAGILARGVETLVEGLGCSVANIIMHSGIGICGSCYEVGSEVMDGCRQRREGMGPWHLDLRQVLAEQGAALGLKNISTSQLCSSHDRPRFFSHRGSGGRDGRMVAYLGWPAEATTAIDAMGDPG